MLGSLFTFSTIYQFFLQIRFGTINKLCQQKKLFLTLGTSINDVGGFLVLSVSNFDQFFTPPPNYRRCLRTAPYYPMSTNTYLSATFDPLDCRCRLWMVPIPNCLQFFIYLCVVTYLTVQGPP